MSKHRPANPKSAAACAAPIDALLDPEWFKALGEPTRVKLLCCVAKCGRACSVGESAACCSVDLSVVSRHLTLLAQAGLLDAEKDGRTVFYRVRYGDIAKALRALASAIDACRPRGAQRGKGGCCASR